jgi:hypothetical protein
VLQLAQKDRSIWPGVAVGITVALVSGLFGENTWDTVTSCVSLGVAAGLGFTAVQMVGDWVSRRGHKAIRSANTRADD